MSIVEHNGFEWHECLYETMTNSILNFTKLTDENKIVQKKSRNDKGGIKYHQQKQQQEQYNTAIRKEKGRRNKQY